MDAETASKLAAGLGIGIATLGPGIGIGIMTGHTAEAIARQPEAMGDIRTTMIIGVALAEALTLYAFVIAILLYAA